MGWRQKEGGETKEEKEAGYKTWSEKPCRETRESIKQKKRGRKKKEGEAVQSTGLGEAGGRNGVSRRLI
jgi:hypothetical protein